MKSDQDAGKKADERHLADIFLVARACATGKVLDICRSEENPDFICYDECGDEVGLEVTQVTRGPIIARWAKVLGGEAELDPFDGGALIYSLLERKERARIERYVKQVRRCVLLLALIESSIPRLRVALDGLESDFASHGFEEVWLADYTEYEAYGNVELFGLYPLEIWGHHIRPNAMSKPYG